MIHCSTVTLLYYNCRPLAYLRTTFSKIEKRVIQQNTEIRKQRKDSTHMIVTEKKNKA